MIVGLIAQFIDGALGMGYGVFSSASLISLGLSPVIASASVHTAEVFTTLVSGSSHFKLGNVEKGMLMPLTTFGVLGGVLGAMGLCGFEAKPVQVVVNWVLLLMGVVIVYRHFAWVTWQVRCSFKNLSLLGFIGALLDAVGGGGWGPVCTSTLVAGGVNPSKAVGSVNLSEFFVTVGESITFLVLIGWENFHWEAVIVLMVAGLVIAPLSAYLCKKVSGKKLGILVGLCVIFLSTRNLLLAAGML